MSIDHYENFPVASILLPARLRPAVRDIYRFARSADDIADEGDASADERLRHLAAYRHALDKIDPAQSAPCQAQAGGQDQNRKQGQNPQQDQSRKQDQNREQDQNQCRDEEIRRIFVPLAQTIRRHDLPLQPFRDLLSAFEQDVTKTRYANDEELLDYCRRSANPVGRLMLCLYGADRPDALLQSDAICTGLQLTNFWQDVAIDWTKNRVYIPQDILHAHQLNESFIGANTGRSSPLPFNRQWNLLMQRQTRQASEFLRSGLPLCRTLGGRIGFELRLIIHGGLRILERLEALNYDVFHQRPTLGKRDWLRLLVRAATQRT